MERQKLNHKQKAKEKALAKMESAAVE